LDCLSLFSDATPVLFGITLDASTTQAPPLPATHASHLAKKTAKIPEVDLRRPLSVRAVDSVTHQPITNAEFFLSIGAEDHVAFLDQKRADASGAAVLHYPPSETVDRVVFARAPGWIAASVRHSRSTLPKLEDNITLELTKGQRVGGLVKDPSGKPIANAQVTLTSVISEKKRETTRADCDIAITGADGRWTSSSAPEDLKNFRFQVRHPDFYSGLFRLPVDPAAATQRSEGASSSRAATNNVQKPASTATDFPPPAVKAKSPKTLAPAANKPAPPVDRATVWKLEELKAGEALATLKPSERIVGVVVDTRKTPVEGAYVGAWGEGAPGDNVMTTTDQQGRFELRQENLRADGKLYVLSDHHAPLAFDWEPGARGSENPLRLVLQPPKTLVGKIADQNRDPVRGAQVRLLSWNGSPSVSWSGVTDAQGRFYWSNAAPGQLGFQLSGTNFQRNQYQMEWNGEDELQMQMQRQAMMFGWVKDQDTGRPIAEFTAVRGYAYNPGEPFRWQRGNAIKGRNGFFSGIIYNYGSDSRQVFMVEAPGYRPTLTEEAKPGSWTTNEVRLKRARGIHGVVELPDGSPARNTPLAMVEGEEWVFIEKNGQINRSSSYTEQLRTDPQGRFEFQPHLRAVRIVAANTAGVADVSGEDVERSGAIRLRPWSRVEGVFKISSGIRSNQVVKLETLRPQQSMESSNRSGAVWVNFKATPDKDGRFVFEQAPPGARVVFVETRLAERRNSSRTGSSHEVIVDLAPGATQSVTLGGGGRRVTGRMRVIGGEPEDVDWLWDVHQLSFNPPLPKGYPTLAFTGNQSAAEQQRMQQKFQADISAFLQTPEGDRYERSRRHFMLQFETNGVFSVDNVPPGDYMLSIAPMEKPSDPDSYSYRQLGRLDRSVHVPSDPKENAVLDLGALDIAIRGSLRVGKKVAPFEIKTSDDQTISSKDLAGKVVLLYFWMNWESSAYDIGVINELLATYEQDKRFVAFLPTGMNKPSLRFATQGHKIDPPIGLLQDWNTDPLVMAFNVQGWPTGVLLDGDGRIVSFQMRGSTIRSTVTRAMSKVAAASAAPNP
ncbi:MAG: hypothetical protein HYR88_07280, partial [Verrucomicrobia bacterium]|nr:hypothetical protein [Verrucomicrobiota bacterium]